MESVIGKTFYSKDGNTDDTSVKNSKVVCLYYSASWCPPCRAFTPMLEEFYNEINADSKQLEIIFVSKDKDEESFDEYFKSEMPWIAIPYNDSRRLQLSDQFDVKGIPTLIVLKKNGEVATKAGRADVQAEFVDAFTKWLDLVE
eukprot:TRINITY_DN819_c0_g1_i2.p2 TRINITY_DN819_c0_g1~~TRINITY_DN819_c0_g1_i2.p2  ORF type:complete len:144 (+),score=37.39 TRINITY_DN819_c0_g1_i2:127-558(+)